MARLGQFVLFSFVIGSLGGVLGFLVSPAFGNSGLYSIEVIGLAGKTIKDRGKLDLVYELYHPRHSHHLTPGIPENTDVTAVGAPKSINEHTFEKEIPTEYFGRVPLVGSSEELMSNGMYRFYFRLFEKSRSDFDTLADQVVEIAPAPNTNKYLQTFTSERGDVVVLFKVRSLDLEDPASFELWSRQPCGLDGNLDERITDCGGETLKTKKGLWRVVTQTLRGSRIVENLDTGLLWSDRQPAGPQHRALTRCLGHLSITGKDVQGEEERGYLDALVSWSLPSAPLMSRAVQLGLNSMYRNMDVYSMENYHLWTTTYAKMDTANWRYVVDGGSSDGEIVEKPVLISNDLYSHCVGIPIR